MPHNVRPNFHIFTQRGPARAVITAIHARARLDHLRRTHAQVFKLQIAFALRDSRPNFSVLHRTDGLIQWPFNPWSNRLPGSFLSAPFDARFGASVSGIRIQCYQHLWFVIGQEHLTICMEVVVGSIDQIGIVDAVKVEGDTEAASDVKTNVNSESDKVKSKRKLFVGSQALGYRRDYMEVIPALKDGIVVDWDLVDNLWDHAFRERLLIDPKEHPMLLAEPSSNSQQQRERTAELIFEKYKVPALFLAKNAVLTSFASGRATSLVVDCGGGSTTVAAVHDGYVLQKAVVSSPIGGEFLTDCLMKTLESKGILVKPRYSFKRKETRPGEFQTIDLDFPNTTESYRRYSQMIIASDIKESVCRVPDTSFDENQYSNIPTTPYELPDGRTIEIGSDRFKIPDLLFNPSLIQTIPNMEKSDDYGLSLRGLPKMVIESINKCDVDIRRELFSSILLAGGTASMQQMKERLEKDLIEEAPPTARVKVLASGNAIERRFSVWIGGSILGSLGSFQQMWFSKAEYEEHGASYIQRKCP